MTRALIIADPQRDFCEGGSLGVGGGAAAVSRIDRLLNSDHGYAQMIASCDHHIDPGGHFAAEPDFVDSWPPHCVVCSAGAEFHDNLTYRDLAAVFYKGHYAPAYSAFEGLSDCRCRPGASGRGIGRARRSRSCHPSLKATAQPLT